MVLAHPHRVDVFGYVRPVKRAQEKAQNEKKGNGATQS
jgi:hypothetical protein